MLLRSNELSVTRRAKHGGLIPEMDVLDGLVRTLEERFHVYPDEDHVLR